MSEIIRPGNVEMTEADQRSEAAKKIIEFIDRSGAYDYFKKLLSSGSGDNKKPTFEEFEDFLIRLNGIAREIPIHERSFDGDGVMLQGWVEETTVPKHSDKEGLLREAFDAASRLEKSDLKYLIPAFHLIKDRH